MRLPIPMPLPRGESLFSWYGAGVGIIWPTIMLWTRRDWRGVHHLGKPGQGMVIAANHLSWVDPFVMAHFVNDNGRSPRFLAKASVFDVPVGGQILKGAQQIPVYRESENAGDALVAAVAAVNAGESLVIYPEGTITRDPDLWPMTGRSGAARIALATGCPVVPVAQWGAHEIMAPYSYDLRPFPPKTMHVWAGEPVNLDDLRDQEVTEPLLRIATDRIMDAITGQLAAIRDEDPPPGRYDMRHQRRVPTSTETLPDSD